MGKGARALILFWSGCVGYGLFIPGDGYGQRVLQRSDPMAPEWLCHRIPVSRDSSYYYQNAEGEGKSLAEAREACLLNLSTYVKQVWKIRSDTRTEIISSDDKEQVTSVFQFDVTGEALRISVGKKDEYWECWENPDRQQVYRCHILYVVYRRSDSDALADLQLTTGYGARGMWRSMLVPGWGQLYKGSRVKGSCILGGEILLIGGLIVGENLRSDYLDKARQTLNVGFRRDYLSRANDWKNVRNICIAGGAALYVYNVIDAIVASGRKRAVERRVAFMPCFEPGDCGVIAGLKISAPFGF